MAENETQGITVEIYDQTYRLRGNDRAYIERLAAMVDTRMRAVAAQGRTADSLRVAVLAALNLADQVVRLEDKCNAANVETAAAVRNRAHSLSGLLDEVLSGDRKAG